MPTIFVMMANVKPQAVDAEHFFFKKTLEIIMCAKVLTFQKSSSVPTVHSKALKTLTRKSFKSTFPAPLYFSKSVQGLHVITGIRDSAISGSQSYIQNTERLLEGN